MVSSKAGILVAVAVLIAGIVLSGCGGGSSDTPPTTGKFGSVSGSIADFSSATPLGGVKITVGGQSATSDANGNFTVTGIKPGHYALIVTPNQDANLTLPPGTSAPTVTVFVDQTTVLSATIYLMDTADVPPTQPS